MTNVTTVLTLIAATIAACAGIFINRKRIFARSSSDFAKLNRNAFLVCFLLIVVMGGLCFGILFASSHHFDVWHLNSLRAYQIWQKATGDSQTIAFIDTGIDDSLAADLGERIVYSHNVIDDSDNVTDLHGHGTEMVSICCGTEREECVGIAPKAKLMILKAVSEEGKTNNALLLQALVLAEQKGATVVNISIGDFQEDTGVSDQIQKMISQGITIVCAVGDYGNKDFLFPASVEGVIPVAAVDKDKKPWSKNNTSDMEAFYMPGVDIQSYTVQNGSVSVSLSQGTSDSAALMSGYIALLRDYYEKTEKGYDNSTVMEAVKEAYSAPLKAFQ